MVLHNALRFLVLFTLTAQFAFAQGIQKIGFEIADGRNRVEIPFESYNNLIVVSLTMNKIIPLKFIVDTGVKTSILADRIYLDILSVNYDRRINIVGAAGGAGVEAFVANNVKLEMPGLVCHGIPIFVMTEDYLRLGNSIGIPVQGILGSEIFNRFVVKIDYSRNVITLFNPEAFRKPRKFSEIDIDLIDSKPYVNLNFFQNKGINIYGKVMIDTGASHPIMLHQASDSSIIIPERKSYSLLGRGLAGNIYGYISRIDSLQIDRYKFSEIITSFPEEATYIDIIRETGRQGTIGGGILNRFTVIFDYSKNKLYLKRAPGFKAPFETDMSGMEVIAAGFDLKIFLVAEVEPNTPASEAGIATGDVVLKVGNIRSKDLTLSKLNYLLHSKPGKEIKLKLMRDKEIIRTKLVLRRLI